MGNVRVMPSLGASISSSRIYRHIEGPSTAFGTSLNYCAIRILGMSVDHPVAVKARGCLHKLGQFVIPAFIDIFSYPSFLQQVPLWPHLPGGNFGSPSWVYMSGKGTIPFHRSSGTAASNPTGYYRCLHLRVQGLA